MASGAIVRPPDDECRRRLPGRRDPVHHDGPGRLHIEAAAADDVDHLPPGRSPARTPVFEHHPAGSD